MNTRTLAEVVVSLVSFRENDTAENDLMSDVPQNLHVCDV